MSGNSNVSCALADDYYHLNYTAWEPSKAELQNKFTMAAEEYRRNNPIYPSNKTIINLVPPCEFKVETDKSDKSDTTTTKL